LFRVLLYYHNIILGIYIYFVWHTLSRSVPRTITRDYDANGRLRISLSLPTTKYVIRRYHRTATKKKINFSHPKTALDVWYCTVQAVICPHRVGCREIIIITARVTHAIQCHHHHCSVIKNIHKPPGPLLDNTTTIMIII